MRIRWYIDDGYVDKDRPHYLDVSDDELDYCDTAEERENLISDCVREEFENTISYYWERM